MPLSSHRSPLTEVGRHANWCRRTQDSREPHSGSVNSLEHAHELGMAGLFFRTVLDMSPALDAGELRDIRAKADELGMYLETGLGKVNPYANPERRSCVPSATATSSSASAG